MLSVTADMHWSCWY